MWTRVNNLHPVELKHKSVQIVSFTTEELISILKNRAAKKLDRFVRVDFHPFVYSIMLMGEEGQQLKGRFLMPTETIGAFQLGDFITFNKTQIIDEITFDVQGDHFIYKKKDTSPIQKAVPPPVTQTSSCQPNAKEITPIEVGLSGLGDLIKFNKPKITDKIAFTVQSEPYKQTRDASPVRKSNSPLSQESTEILSSPQLLSVEEVVPVGEKIIFGIFNTDGKMWFFMKHGTKTTYLKKNGAGNWDLAKAGRPPTLDTNSLRYCIPWTQTPYGIRIDSRYENKKYIDELQSRNEIELMPGDI